MEELIATRYKASRRKCVSLRSNALKPLQADQPVNGRSTIGSHSASETMKTTNKLNYQRIVNITLCL